MTESADFSLIVESLLLYFVFFGGDRGRFNQLNQLCIARQKPVIAWIQQFFKGFS